MAAEQTPRTAAATEARRANAQRRRFEQYATEMRTAGWVVVAPESYCGCRTGVTVTVRHTEECEATGRLPLVTDEQILDYWDEHIRPTLGVMPDDGIAHLRGRYVADVRANPEAVRQIHYAR